MADFYQKVATPQTQMRQQSGPSGATTDVNARAEAQNKAQSNIGRAIQGILGVAQGVSDIYDRDQEYKAKKEAVEFKRMKMEHSLDIKSDMAGYVQELQTSIASDGKPLTDYTPEELKKKMIEKSEGISKGRGFGEKTYYKALQEEINNKNEAFFQRQLGVNQEFQLNKSYKAASSEISDILRATEEPSEVLREFNNILDENVGYGSRMVDIDGTQSEVRYSIQDSRENAELRLLQPLVESAMRDGDVAMVSMLDSQEFRDRFSNISDYPAMVDAAKKQTQSVLNKNRQINLDRVSESAFMSVDMGVVSGDAAIDEYVDNQVKAIKQEYNRPSTEDILKLKSKLKKASEETVSFNQYYSAMKDGDYTFGKRSNIPKADLDKMDDRMFSVETGITDLSPEGLSNAIKSGLKDDALKAYFNSGLPISPALKAAANTPATGGWKGIREKSETFTMLQSLTQDTSKTALDLFSPDEYSRMMHVREIIDTADSGAITQDQAYQMYSKFNNDREKNIDSMGVYRSPKSSAIMRDEKVQQWIQEQSTDAPWKFDDYSGSDYIKLQHEKYLSLALDTTDSIEDAKDLATKMFYSNNTQIENPDGSEGVIPSEFSAFTVKDFVKVAENSDKFSSRRSASGYLGLFKEYSFERNLAFRPSVDYDKTGLMDFYYDGQFVMSLSSRDMESQLSGINKANVEAAEQRNIDITQNR